MQGGSLPLLGSPEFIDINAISDPPDRGSPPMSLPAPGSRDKLLVSLKVNDFKYRTLLILLVFIRKQPLLK